MTVGQTYWYISSKMEINERDWRGKKIDHFRKIHLGIFDSYEDALKEFDDIRLAVRNSRWQDNQK